MEFDGSDQMATCGAERLSARPPRTWTAAEKLAIVEESFSSSGTVTATARAHGISTSTLSRWRQIFREDRSFGDQPSGFVPARVVANVPGLAGRMEIVIANGRRVVVGDDFDGLALSRLLDVLEARP